MAFLVYEPGPDTNVTSVPNLTHACPLPLCVDHKKVDKTTPNVIPFNCQYYSLDIIFAELISVIVEEINYLKIISWNYFK